MADTRQPLATHASKGNVPAMAANSNGILLPFAFVRYDTHILTGQKLSAEDKKRLLKRYRQEEEQRIRENHPWPPNVPRSYDANQLGQNPRYVSRGRTSDIVRKMARKEAAEQRALEAVEAQGCALQSLCELRHDLAAATPSSSSSGPCNPSAAPSSSSRTGQNPSTARAEDSATAEQVITQAVNEGHGEEYVAMLCQDALDRGVMSRVALDALLDLLHLQAADAHPEEEVAIPGILGEAPVTPEDEEEEPFEDHGTADMEVAQMIAMAELQLMQESERGEWGSSCCM